MSAARPEIRIIGVGNVFRSDDGAGLAVAQRVRGRITEGVAICEESGDGAELLELWKGAGTVILVDAVESGAAPGTVHRLDASATAIPRRIFRYSTHGFGVAEAVEMARTLNQMPARLIVYGIEGKNFAAGAALSPEVEQAAAEVTLRIIDEVRALRGQ
ncbi:MAG TPA: hydrogenase maturation protease [Candidatus Acidoferrales bacterium]|nr:hydrogenase maturation protease [Candidatus Acidoferrales bacterium]